MKGGVAWLKSLIKCYKRTPKLLLLTSSFLLFELSVSLLLGALLCMEDLGERETDGGMRQRKGVREKVC